jgi:hypothetical protein
MSSVFSPSRFLRAVVAGLPLAAAQAGATVWAAPADRPRDYVNLRIGAAAVGELGGRAEICLEVFPLPFLSIEGCGNGSGFLHGEDAPELAHFRTKLRLTSFRRGELFVEPQLGAGFAELQIGQDAPGFHFTGTDRHRLETSGFEGTAALRALLPLSPGWEALAVLSFSVAYLPHAPDLVRPLGAVQPSLSLTVGVGF